MLPERTVRSNRAAAHRGADILERNVTCMEDEELVCRPPQNDRHPTTDFAITDRPSTCITPSSEAADDAGATAECRTSKITSKELRTPRAKMDTAGASAETAEAHLGGVVPFRTPLYPDAAELMADTGSIELPQALGTEFTPEPK